MKEARGIMRVDDHRRRAGDVVQRVRVLVTRRPNQKAQLDINEVIDEVVGHGAV